MQRQGLERLKLERTMCDVQYAEVAGRENPTDLRTNGVAAEAIPKHVSAVSGRYWVRLAVLNISPQSLSNFTFHCKVHEGTWSDDAGRT